jgi:hypothetical protein
MKTVTPCRPQLCPWWADPSGRPEPVVTTPLCERASTAAVLAFSSASAHPEHAAGRKGLFAPVADVPADASAVDTALGLAGRDPASRARFAHPQPVPLFTCASVSLSSHRWSWRTTSLPGGSRLRRGHLSPGQQLQDGAGRARRRSPRVAASLPGAPHTMLEVAWSLRRSLSWLPTRRFFTIPHFDGY